MEGEDNNGKGIGGGTNGVYGDGEPGRIGAHIAFGLSPLSTHICMQIKWSCTLQQSQHAFMPQCIKQSHFLRKWHAVQPRMNAPTLSHFSSKIENFDGKRPHDLTPLHFFF
jgi:hypothetical protein